MTHDSSNQVRLADMIEKLIISGRVSRDDQNEINQRARTSNMDREDGMAINKLTELIVQGQINVN